jgi:hypothetical protein
MNTLSTYTVDYLDTNGLATFVDVKADSTGMAEDVFCEVWGEHLEIVEIHLTKEAA